MFLGIVGFIFFNKIVFILGGKTACGQIQEKRDSTYGSKVFSYEFYIDDIKYEGIVSPADVVDSMSIEELRKLNCIKIEYWESFPSRNSVIDKRILR